VSDEKKEAFLDRWSRLKHEEKAKPPVAEEKPRPALPPTEQLTPESDFTGFMHPKVEDALRRAALKKLFGDPHFNTPDPFEPFSGDWTGGGEITPELLATLNQARTHLFSQEKKEEQQQPAEQQPQLAEEKPKPADEPGKQDA
jgi:hypothetical protein